MNTPIHLCKKKQQGQLLTERRVLPCKTVRRASPLVA